MNKPSLLLLQYVLLTEPQNGREWLGERVGLEKDPISIPSPNSLLRSMESGEKWYHHEDGSIWRLRDTRGIPEKRIISLMRTPNPFVTGRLLRENQLYLY